MSEEPAGLEPDQAPLNIVKLAIAAYLRENIPSPIKVIDDHDRHRTIEKGMLPCIAVGIEGVEIAPRGGESEIVESFVLTIDIYEGGRTYRTISSQAAIYATQVRAALARDPSIGGLLEDLIATDFTTDEDSTPDTMACTLVCAGQFVTDFNNPFHIIRAHD